MNPPSLTKRIPAPAIRPFLFVSWLRMEKPVSGICKEEGIGVGEMRMGGQRRGVSRARERIAWVLSREYGVSLAEIGRQVGVCTSAVGKALRKKEG
jgi:hypothetical protein